MADVTDRGSLEALREYAIESFGRIDILINCAGGNVKVSEETFLIFGLSCEPVEQEATIGDDESFFDMPHTAVEKVMKLNFSGT